MESAGIGLVGGGNNGAGQKNPASAQCEMGRGNAPYPSSASAASAADQFHDQTILFQDSLHPSLAQDTPPPSVEDYQNRSLDMPHLNDDDMTDIFQLHDQLQQQQQDQQQLQVGLTPFSYSEQDYHMVPSFTGQPTPASTTATSPPSSPPEDSAAGTPATPSAGHAQQNHQNMQNHPNLGDFLSSDLHPQADPPQEHQQQQQMSQTPRPYTDASYQPPTSVLSHTSEVSEADGGVVAVSRLNLPEKKREAKEKKRSRTSRSSMAIQTQKILQEATSSAESEVEDPSSKKTKTVIHIQREQREWLDCQVIGCPFWTNKKERMERHMMCHPNKFSKNLKCPDCGVKFFSLAKMLKHDRKEHTGVKDWECRICGAEVTEIAVHMKVRKIPAYEIGTRVVDNCGGS